MTNEDKLREKYMEFQYFKGHVTIEKAWKTRVKISNLAVDNKLKNSEKLVQRFIDSILKPITKKGALLDSWNYLTYLKLPEIAHYIVNGNSEEFTPELLIEKLEKDFMAETVGECRPYVLRDTVLLGEINFISEDDLNSGNFKLRKNNQAYFDKYATRIQIKKENGELLVKPISWPKNYKLNPDWQPYEEFHRMLHNPMNPKIQFFALDNPRLSSKKEAVFA